MRFKKSLIFFNLHYALVIENVVWLTLPAAVSQNIDKKIIYPRS